MNNSFLQSVIIYLLLLFIILRVSKRFPGMVLTDTRAISLALLAGY